LSIGPDRTATLTCGDGNGKVVYAEELAFTDYPREKITLWYANNVIYLPSEH
jgi:hypothetical protein